MAYTLADLEAIQQAYALGALKVKYTDKEVEYRSRVDMQAIISEIKQELGLVNPNSRRRYGAYFRD